MESALDTGNTAWMLTASALVLLMIPGLAFFYGGMVRSKSVLNMLMMIMGALFIVGILWVIYGYSMAFGNSYGQAGLLGNVTQYIGLEGLMVDDPEAANNAIGGPSNTQQLGKLLYTEYLYPLEIAAAILLVAMIAAIALTLRERKDSKYVSPGDQVRVKAQDRMTVLKMDATQEAPAPAPPEAAATPETKA